MAEHGAVDDLGNSKMHPRPALAQIQRWSPVVLASVQVPGNLIKGQTDQTCSERNGLDCRNAFGMNGCVRAQARRRTCGGDAEEGTSRCRQPRRSGPSSILFGATIAHSPGPLGASSYIPSHVSWGIRTVLWARTSRGVCAGSVLGNVRRVYFRVPLITDQTHR